MAGYRSSVIQRLHPIAGSIPLSLLLKATGQKLILPVYHLVSDPEVPHIRHLCQPKNTAAFVRDLEFLLKNFQPLDFNDLVQYITGERTLSRPAFFLTFDDGLREFYSVIAPILENRGIPAMNFLNPAFIDNKDLFYRYKISLLIENLKNRDTSQFIPLINSRLRTTTKRNSSVITQLLQLKYQDIPLIDEIAAVMEVDFQVYLKEKQPYLNTEEVNDLIQRGFTFGAHSMDHPLYSDLDLSTQIRQTLDSIDAVIHKFGINYRTFAFPFTDYKVSRKFFDYLYGSEKLDLTFGSAGLKEDIYRQHLQRIPMEMGDLSARAIIHTELLYYYLKGFAGKNRINRL